MISVSENNIFVLGNSGFSYIFRISPEGLLEHLHYGGSLKSPFNVPIHHRRTPRGAVSHYKGLENVNLNAMPQEYPVFGTSDYRFPAIHMIQASGNTISDFVYVGHEIVKDKPRLAGLPSARGGDSQTLILSLVDSLSNVEVKLYYTVWEDYGVIARSVVVTNNGQAAVNLNHIYSSAIDLPFADYESLHLSGTWAREMNACRHNLAPGRFTIDSARGTSSAAHHPFLAVLEQGAGETHGRVFASTLMYSGNFSMSAETSEFGDVRLLTGLNPFNFNWKLEPGERFTTPEALHVYSGSGLSEMSRLWHDFIRDKVSPPKFKNRARPTYINSWEASYFDIDEDKVLALSDKAVQLGVDMVVVDDGWFKGRRNDKTSLGDWTEDEGRFPSGMDALAKAVKAKGLKFGLWFEPEMVSPDSDLYRVHPDWAIHVLGRRTSLGRNQLTLDLSRPEVCDYIYDSLDTLLSDGNIDYVKWDMNRNMTDVGSAALSPDRQRETAHRYMLGLYGILDRLTAAYPDVQFENCASGGNRADLGMLFYMPQSWTSDMCDPVGRLSIINGLSYLYPLDTTASYIGPSPNHQNGRMSSIKTRYLAGIFCPAKGISLSNSDIDADFEALKTHMDYAKETQLEFLGGRFTRIAHTQNKTIWQYETSDKQTIYVAYFNILSAPNLPFERAYLRALPQGAVYICQDTDAAYSSDVLMHSGLPLPYITTDPAHDGDQGQGQNLYMDEGDFSAHLFTLKRSS